MLIRLFKYYCCKYHRRTRQVAGCAGQLLLSQQGWPRLLGLLLMMGGFFLVALHVAPAQVRATRAQFEIRRWAATTALPQALAQRNTVAHRDHLLVIGGKSDAGLPSPTIYAARRNDDGSLGLWRAAGQLPVGLYLHAAVVVDNSLFIIGGWDGSDTRSNVWYATLGDDGEVFGWQETSALPVGLDLHDAVFINGHIYVVGGWDGNQAQQQIYAAAVTAAGTGTWTEVGLLPTSLYRLAVTAANGYLYVTGGFDSADRDVDVVSSAAVNGTNPLGPWRAEPLLPSPRFYHKALIHDGHLVVLGGQNASGALAEVVSAPLLADGRLGNWRAEASLPVAIYRFGAATATVNGADVIYVTGGLRGEDETQFNVYHSTVPPVATPTATPTNTPTPTPTVTPTPTPALHLHLYNDPATWLAPGDETTYTITYANSGSETLENVEIYNTIPAGSELVDGTIRSSAGNFSTTGHDPGSTITWRIGDVAAANSGEVAYRVRRQITPTPAVPLALTIEIGAPEVAAANTEITYQFTVTNRSPIVLNDLVITNRVPTGAIYLRGADRRPVDGIVQWTVATLAADSATTVQYVVTAAESLVNHQYRAETSGGVNARGRALAVTVIDNQPPKAGDNVVIINEGARAAWGIQGLDHTLESNPSFNPSYQLYLPAIQR